MDSEPDILHMRMALREAAKGVGRTHPNPAVGAVIVRGEQVLSSGWHRGAGQPHAEIEALRGLASPSEAKGATIYITLEPCSTHGRTPPCTEAILSSGLARVVYGAADPNPCHAGRADAILRAGGVDVSSGVLADECLDLNRAWNKWIATGIPYVVAKAGMSLDGRIASPPGRRWITSDEAREDAMDLRVRSGAILVGGETVRTDNPSLTVRGRPGCPQPWRAIWTRSGNLPPDSRVLTDEFRDRTLVYAGQSLRDVLADLGSRGVEQVLIEGGGQTLGEAFDQRLVDRVVFYMAPVLIGGPIPAVGGKGSESSRLISPQYRLVGGDLRIEGEVRPTTPKAI